MKNSYDEIKDLLKKSRLITENTENEFSVGSEVTVKPDVSDDEVVDGSEEEGVEPTKYEQQYRISGGLITIYGHDKQSVELTSMEKENFQQTMDEFVEQVTELAEFDQLSIYPNSVSFAGKIIDLNLDYRMTIGEENGLYVDGTYINVNDDFMETMENLRKFYEMFKTKWGKVVASRRTRFSGNNEE